MKMAITPAVLETNVFWDIVRWKFVVRMLCRGKDCGENCIRRENCGGILRRGKIMKKIITDTKLCEYFGGRESCRDTVNGKKIVATSCRERTFSELIIFTCVFVLVMWSCRTLLWWSCQGLWSGNACGSCEGKEECIEGFCGKHEWKRPLGRPRLMCQEILKWTVKKYDASLWTEFMCLDGGRWLAARELLASKNVSAPWN